MKEKGSVKKALLQILAVVAEDEIDIDIYSWPPHCATILYQPERPCTDLVSKLREDIKNDAIYCR